MFLSEDCSKQVLHVGKLMLGVDLQAPPRAFLSRLKPMEIIVRGCIEQPILREVDGIEFEQHIRVVNYFLPLLVMHRQSSQLLVRTDKVWISRQGLTEGLA